MNRHYRSGGGRALELTTHPAGAGHRVLVRENEQAEEIDAQSRWTPQGDLLVETAGIVRRVAVSAAPGAVWLSRGGHTWRWAAVQSARGGKAAHEEAILRAPMTGRVVLVHVEPGQAVAAGQALVVVEAMKMEHALRAPRDCTVAQVWCAVGQLVETGQDLVELSAP